jgi:hypothetical protein
MQWPHRSLFFWATFVTIQIWFYSIMSWVMYATACIGGERGSCGATWSSGFREAFSGLGILGVVIIACVAALIALVLWGSAIVLGHFLHKNTSKK